MGKKWNDFLFLYEIDSISRNILIPFWKENIRVTGGSEKLIIAYRDIN